MRLVVVISNYYQLEFVQLDVKSAFRNGKLEEEVYIEKPQGFVVKGEEDKVSKLNRALYGLKQAPKS